VGERTSFNPRIDAWHRIAVSVPNGQPPPSIALCIAIDRNRST
jgi:hypothetical protein